MKPTNPLRALFLLRDDVTYLNFGSFGACPKPVFDDYQKWQLELEREPVQFIAFNGPAYMKTARKALSDYVGCRADDLVFTTNPTFAVNIIARNFPLKEGDEILSTDLEYGALDRTWNYLCAKHGAKYVRQPIRFPLTSKEDFINQFFSGFTGKTKAIFISQITSATALILPVKEICGEAKRRGLTTIVDGAHVPGHIPLNLQELKADYYTGACHKWLMTPKGCSFLYAKQEFQPLLDPLVISWGYESENPSGSTFIDYHEFNGTRDFSACLTVPAAIEFMRAHQWDEVSKACRDMVREWAPRFCDLAGTEPIAPVAEEFLGQMFSIPVRVKEPAAFQKKLFDHYHIEVPLTRRGGDIFIRYSVNGFNTQQDLQQLYDAMTLELNR